MVVVVVVAVVTVVVVIVVAVVVVVGVAIFYVCGVVAVLPVDPRNLPLMFGQNGVSNSLGISDIEFVC